jgi:hypothetical protein
VQQEAEPAEQDREDQYEQDQSHGWCSSIAVLYWLRLPGR